MEELASTRGSVSAHQVLKEISVKQVNVNSCAEMEENVAARTSANVPRATKETCAQNLFVNPHVVHMGPALNPTNANARKAGMVDTVTKGMEPTL